jgi:hypothetical protein
MDGGWRTYAKARVSILAKQVNWEKPMISRREGDAPVGSIRK